VMSKNRLFQRYDDIPVLVRDLLYLGDVLEDIQKPYRLVDGNCAGRYPPVDAVVSACGYHLQAGKTSQPLRDVHCFVPAIRRDDLDIDPSFKKPGIRDLFLLSGLGLRGPRRSRAVLSKRGLCRRLIFCRRHPRVPLGFFNLRRARGPRLCFGFCDGAGQAFILGLEASFDLLPAFVEQSFFLTGRR
jgi:hypothetical protein